MLQADALLEALRSIAFRSQQGYSTRFVPERYRATALSAVGSLRKGGRYNPPGTSALYTSLERVTALQEVTELLADEDPLVPYLMLTVEYSSDRVLDLTERSNIQALATSRDELTQRISHFHQGTAPTQLLGAAAIIVGFDAIIAPSRPAHRGTNLILFPERSGVGSVTVYTEPPIMFEDETFPENVIRFPRRPADA